MHDDYQKYIKPAFIDGEINGKKQKSAQKTLYWDHFPSISNLFKATNGEINQKTAQKIFDQSFMVLSIKVMDKGFDLDCSLKKYLWAISWKIWSKNVTKSNKVVLNEYPSDCDKKRFDKLEIDPILRKIDIWEKTEIVLNDLDEPCRNLLKLWAKGKHQEALKLFPSFESIEMLKQQITISLIKFIEKVKKHL